MNIISVLLRQAVRRYRIWFATEGAGKTVVILAFILLLALISFSLYRISALFFTNLAYYEEFGRITAAYVIHAAIIVTVWIGITSAVTQSVAVFIGNSSERGFLKTLPVSQRIVDVYEYLIAVASGVLLLAVVFVPVASAYASAFSVSPQAYVLPAFFILVMLSVVTGSAGFILSRMIMRVFGSPSYLFLSLGFFIFLAGMIGIIRVIFPPALLSLYTASAESFPGIYEGLPLNKSYLPTYWMTQALVADPGMSLALSAAFTAAWSAVALMLSRKIRVEWSGPSPSGFSPRLPRFFLSRLPVASDTLLSVLRSPSELGYAGFLFSLAAFFFIVLPNTVNVRRTDGQWAVGLIIFMFAWMLFFTASLAMRFLFPMMASEGPVSWHIFTQPVKRSRILLQKLVLALLTGITLSVSCSIVWFRFPLGSVFGDGLIGFTFISVTTLAVVITLYGAVRPNFTEGRNPEKVSTGMMGILTLGVSVLFSGLSAYLAVDMVSGTSTQTESAIPLIISAVVLAVTAYFAAGRSLARYEF
jgi:hypothetical protein